MRVILSDVHLSAACQTGPLVLYSQLCVHTFDTSGSRTSSHSCLRRRLNIDALPAELHADAQCPGVNIIAPGRIKGDPRVIRVIQPQAALPIAHHVPDQYNGTNLAVIDERASFLYLSYSSSAGVSMCS